MSASVELTVFVPPCGGADALEQQLRRTLDACWQGHAGLPLVIETARDDELFERLSQLRKARPQSVIGVVTLAPDTISEALSRGADEVVHVADGDGPLDDFCVRLSSRVRYRITSEPAPTLGTILEDLIGGIAHEINNPLSTITLGLDVLRSSALGDLERLWALQSAVEQGIIPAETAQLLPTPKSDAQETRSLFEDLVAATDTIAHIVRAARVFAKATAAERPQLLRVHHALNQALLLVRRELGPHAIVEFDLQEDSPPVFLPPHRLTQALTGLLFYASRTIRAVPRDFHRVCIRIEPIGPQLSISITDSSPRQEAPESARGARVEGRSEPQNLPGDLTFVSKVIEELGGTISARMDDAIAFECTLPIAGDEAQESSRRPTYGGGSSSPPPSGNCSVLLVDDDPRLLRTVARILQDHCRVVVARDGAEAQEILARGMTPSAILMEVSLPEIEGPELMDWLSRTRPQLLPHVGFLTGARGQPRFAEFLRRHEDRVLEKPAKPMMVLRLLRKLAPNSLPRSALFAYEAF